MDNPIIVSTISTLKFPAEEMIAMHEQDEAEYKLGMVKKNIGNGG